MFPPKPNSYRSINEKKQYSSLCNLFADSLRLHYSIKAGRNGYIIMERIHA